MIFEVLSYIFEFTDINEKREIISILGLSDGIKMLYHNFGNFLDKIKHNIKY